MQDFRDLSELEYQLLLAKDQKILEIPVVEALSGQTTEVKRMLTALLSRLTAES